VFEQRDAVHEEIRASQIVVAWPDGREPRVVATARRSPTLVPGRREDRVHARP
jgi:hypothetical protein